MSVCAEFQLSSSPQEKKWTAEFNEVMQTVIEDHKEAKAKEWSAPTTSEAKVSEPTATSPPGGSGAAWETPTTPAEPVNGSSAWISFSPAEFWNQ